MPRLTRRRNIVLGALAIVALYFALFGGEYSVFEQLRLKHERTREAARLAALRAEVDSLRARADSLENDPAAIERVAREKYGLIREGERLYRFGRDSASRK
jgi:cell division protein FtsB